jgi:hypothetical protein
MSCSSICPTTQTANTIQECLLKTQLSYPLLGVVPAALQVIFSLGQWLASWMSSEGAAHRRMAKFCLLVSLGNTITLGLGLPIFSYCVSKN